MKKRYILFFLVPSLYFTQTKDERARIASFSNIERNAHQQQRLQKRENERVLRLRNYVSNNPSIILIERFGEFGKKELIDITADGSPLYFQTSNVGSAITARANKLYNGGGLGLNIQGQGMLAGIWDGGSVRTTHQEFNVGGISKITVADGSAMDNHATHVAGTISAQGINSDVRGVAFNSSLVSYNWTNDLGEMLGQASQGLLVSNHSYGPSLSSTNQLWLLGAYSEDAKEVDDICFNNPYYLPVFAAGNDRSKLSVVPYNSQIAIKSGHDLIAGEAVGKNVLTVAAVGQVDNYAGTGDVLMSNFSNYGPTDDGRIKPEISMKGVDVLSTTFFSNTSVGFNSGTSMAAPGVTGVVLLLQQYYKQLYNNYMRAATVKGLIMHTADEAGSTDGPDYQFGWGLVNAEAAAKAIRDKNLATGKSIIEENTLTNGSTYTKVLTTNGSQPVRISISWTDPQYGTANNGTTDPAGAKYLVNDLDVKVTSASGTIHYPWKLYGLTGLFNTPTNTSTNDVDNFERVDIPLASGSYTITVTHKGILQGGSPQNFTLIATGGNISTLSSLESSLKNDEITIYPNPVKNVINIKNNKNLNADVIILDMSGKLIKKQILSENKIYVDDLAAGNYMLLYKDSEGNEKSFKFTKL
ncbi:S8 family serine peptidase [Chryseobacterium taihuense]|uniref:Por secretion system C-terminal sorting domain-containing protein n=1 Tax=Chryseobacterium taihuense TaxID=1141221 RepID=A0ABY0QQW4_9FLAO|nr:S8 family serine peptidase [Chryseobacterium taihuense]SDL56371.1 Por secretion system C-terminal sorting domain-containing protein [Chryseobacterium taihuense]